MKRKNIILICFLLILFILLILLSYYIINIFINYNSSKSFVDTLVSFKEKNSESVFSVNKITYFSSCNANINTNSNSVFTISDLYQYTDIAIFITPNIKENTLKSTLKSVEITNIHYNLLPDIGTPNLYYKNINEFAKPKYLDEYKIKNSILFNTTSEENIDYSTPTLYNNCANPITLSYVNSNIKDSYTLNNSFSNISYDGSLLKTCGITLNSISCKINLTINITNNLDELYTCPLTLTIPLSTENSTLYDGSLILKDSTSYNFILNS